MKQQINLSPDVAQFVEALTCYVNERLAIIGADDDYMDEAVQILDARNGLFRWQAGALTDEENDCYALRSLCRLDGESMTLLPDEGRIRSIARNYF